MVKTIRHTLLLLTALCLTVACEKQEPKSQLQSSAMEFDVAGITRAASTTSQNITEYPFAVYGDMTFIENGSRIEIFNGSKVYYEGNWKYTDTQYWFPNHNHSFIALYPYPDIANTVCLSDTQYTSDSKLKFTYTYPLSDYKKATDVLVATHRRKYTEGNATPVGLIFAHILSNINIQVSYTNPNADAVPLLMNSITFNNIPVEANYAITPAPLTGNSVMTPDYVSDPDSFRGWTITKHDNLTINFPESGKEVRYVAPGGQPHQLFSNNDTLLLLPNPKAPTEMIVEYTTYDDNGAHANTEQLSIPQGWQPGFSYTLSISFTNGKVEFSVTVTEWNPTKPINNTVPRK